ncbi:reverse transcriptase domain-containing protein [Tanacetum coccineum]
MMTATATFIRFDFRNQPKDGRGSNKFTPLTRTPKEIFTAESGKFKPPSPMVTSVEKRSSNKFCELHNDKGHNTDECMQLKKQIEELVRAGNISHFIKEIRQDKDQQRTGKKDAPVKDKAAAIYMIQLWQSVTRQKVTQSFDRAKEITFPPLAVNEGIKGPLIIEAEIGGHTVHCMYVDGGSSMEVLFKHCFNRLRPEIKSQMVPATLLIGFSGETIWPLRQLRLLVSIGDAKHSIKSWMNFMIVRSPSPYNGIIGRPRISEIQAIPSTTHGMLKFPVDVRIVTIRSTILMPTEYQEITIRGAISTKGRTELCALLKGNLDIFAWQPSDMTGVPRSIAEYKLNIREGYLPVWQKKRGHAPECAKAIQTEVQKLVEAGIMRKVYYHDWLSNPVIIKKHDGSWRMCIDFTDLNKACPQDCYPLPEIDWKVESLCGYPFKCFLEAYKGYHQIHMAESDEEKTTFHTPQGSSGRDVPGEVQSLNGKLAGLNRFLSKSAEKSLPLFKTLKKCVKKSDFHWTSEAEQAFKQLKQHISELPMLVAPRPKEELIMYLSASHGAIGAVLMTERDTIQTPFYFASRALQGSELNYTPMEKLILALVFAAKRLRRYF